MQKLRKNGEKPQNRVENKKEGAYKHKKGGLIHPHLSGLIHTLVGPYSLPLYFVNNG